MSGHCYNCGETGGCDCPQPPAADDLVERLKSSAKAFRVQATEMEQAATRIQSDAARIAALEARVKVLEEAIQTIRGGGRSKGTWHDVVKQLVARFEVAEKFGGEAIHNSEGSAAIAELLRQMAGRLDRSARAARAALGER